MCAESESKGYYTTYICVPMKDMQTKPLIYLLVHLPSEALAPQLPRRTSPALNIRSFCELLQIQARQHEMGPVHCCKISHKGFSAISHRLGRNLRLRVSVGLDKKILSLFSSNLHFKSQRVCDNITAWPAYYLILNITIQ